MSADQLSEEQLTEIKQVFDRFDQEETGQISSKDLGNILRSFGIDVLDRDLTDLLEEINRDNGGKISFSSFLEILISRLDNLEFEKMIISAFEVFDSTKRGIISASELRYLMTHLGERLSEEEVNEMIREADVDGTGQIDYRSFVKRMMR
jgi:calmodulin